MTVRTTLAYGRNFHFYLQAHENNYVYLELEDVPYEAGYRRVMLALPVDVWETLRGLAATQLELVNASDADLIELVTLKVGERVREYESSRASSPETADSVRFKNSIMFGLADAPREEQVERGLQYYNLERERQGSIVARMAQHKIIEIAAECLQITFMQNTGATMNYSRKSIRRWTAQMLFTSRKLKMKACFLRI